MELSRVFWDTNLFIYLFEGASQNAVRVFELRERMIERGDELCTSTMTLGELLTKPIALHRPDLVETYEAALSSSNVLMASFDRAAARRFADIRQDTSIKPPDAIQLACASQMGTNLFVTNDDRLSRKRIPGIDFIVPLARAFL